MSETTAKKYPYALRPATKSDAKPIANIVKAVNRSIVSNDEKHGFLIYDLGLEEYYRKLTLDHKYSFVAVNDYGQHCGFIISMTKENLEKDLSCGFLDYEKSILTKSFEIVGNDNFVWGDQMAVYPDSYRKKGVGTSLLNRVFEEMKKENVKHFLGMVALSPSTNCAGLNLLIKSGLRVIDSVENSGIKWGIVYYDVK